MPARSLRIAAALITALAAPARAGGTLPPGFVWLADVAPAILQDMRYAGPDNFTGRPVPGYAAPECILRAEVAAALARAQAELATQSLALKVYDCYRPAAAVRAFVAWAHDGRPAGASKRFFPALDKRALFARGYISARSRHSTGTAVDLTLVPLPTPSAPPFDPRAPYADCTAPANLRAPDNSLDMGTGYDCFDERSHTRSGAITAEARRRRDLLVAVLRRHGLHNYPREWWHFSYYGAGRPPARDFPVTARPSRD